MKEAIHGGDVYSREIILDFSANINPLGLPEGVKKALIENLDRCALYPDRHCAALCNAIAEKENVSVNRVICGGGAADLLYRAVRTLRPGRAVIAVPTFTEYERALDETGCAVTRYPLREERNFALDDGILPLIGRAELVILCSPNNPVGNLIDEQLLRRVVKECEACGTLLLLDQCFAGFAGENSPLLSPNVLLLRAFTKLYAMAGLRLGYMISENAALLGEIDRCGPCWNVSVPAQIAGEAALKETDYIARTRSLIAREREYLSEALRGFGWKTYPSQANFLLFRCPLPLDTWLLEEKIAIRSCTDFAGLNESYFRVAVRTHKENAALTAAIERSMKRNG